MLISKNVSMTSIRLRSVLIASCVLILAACSGNTRPEDDDPALLNSGKSQEELRAEAVEMYRAARKNLDSGDYAAALRSYEAIKARVPFSEFATQSELEGI